MKQNGWRCCFWRIHSFFLKRCGKFILTDIPDMDFLLKLISHWHTHPQPFDPLSIPPGLPNVFTDLGKYNFIRDVIFRELVLNRVCCIRKVFAASCQVIHECL